MLQPIATQEWPGGLTPKYLVQAQTPHCSPHVKKHRMAHPDPMEKGLQRHSGTAKEWYHMELLPQIWQHTSQVQEMKATPYLHSQQVLALSATISFLAQAFF